MQIRQETIYSLWVIVCQLLLCTFTQVVTHQFFFLRLKLCRSKYHLSYVFQTRLSFAVALKYLSPVFYFGSEKDLWNIKWWMEFFPVCPHSLLSFLLPSPAHPNFCLTHQQIFFEAQVYISCWNRVVVKI